RLGGDWWCRPRDPLAKCGACERERRGRLPHPVRPMEQVGVRIPPPRDDAAQELGDGGLAEGGGEGDGEHGRRVYANASRMRTNPRRIALAPKAMWGSGMSRRRTVMVSMWIAGN